MTTTELIKILQDNEKGGISHKSRQISLTINGRYMPNPQITLSSTGDGIAGAEIDFDVDGEWFEHEDDKHLKVIQDEAHNSLNALMATLYNKGYQDGAKALAEHHELCRDEVDGTDAVIDKIRTEIETQEKWLLKAGCNTYNVDIAFWSIKSVLTESEDKNGNNNL